MVSGRKRAHMGKLPCFKSYDIRGKLDEELTAELSYRIGRGFAVSLAPQTVVIGYDIRPTSPTLAAALCEGLQDEGVDVIDLGLCGTEEVYFATSRYGAGGGMMVTASHNPIDYNGIKMVCAGSRPVSSADGLDAIEALVASNDFASHKVRGRHIRKNPRAEYADCVVSFVDRKKLKPLKILVNAGNGVAGPAFDAIAERLKGTGLDFIRHNHTPDESFPNGIPNPLLIENRSQTAKALQDAEANIGVAWDGDFDRCFFFDETGAFIDGEYIVGLLASTFLAKLPGAKIIHDPRVIWALLDIIDKGAGQAIASQSGHSHIKAKMREVDAVYGGEMSAHHYFRDFMYCDSGMIPWLLVVEHICATGQKLSQLVADLQIRFPSSGEINFEIDDKDAGMTAIERTYLPRAKAVDRLDGLSLDMGDWRLNLRQSNTEALLRLNIETKANRPLLNEKIKEVSQIITST